MTLSLQKYTLNWYTLRNQNREIDPKIYTLVLHKLGSQFSYQRLFLLYKFIRPIVRGGTRKAKEKKIHPEPAQHPKETNLRLTFFLLYKLLPAATQSLFSRPSFAHSRNSTNPVCLAFTREPTTRQALEFISCGRERTDPTDSVQQKTFLDEKGCQSREQKIFFEEKGSTTRTFFVTLFYILPCYLFSTRKSSLHWEYYAWYANPTDKGTGVEALKYSPPTCTGA